MKYWALCLIVAALALAACNSSRDAEQAAAAAAHARNAADAAAAQAANQPAAVAQISHFEVMNEDGSLLATFDRTAAGTWTRNLGSGQEVTFEEIGSSPLTLVNADIDGGIVLDPQGAFYYNAGGPQSGTFPISVRNVR